MSEHRARISWVLSGDEFARGRYSREHTWEFDGGITVPASPSPDNVPAPFSNAASVDPEEAFVASISSCHMLTFLHLASKAGIVVTRYSDDAVGRMTQDANGVAWVSRVTLRPEIAYAGDAPDTETLHALHHEAHGQCFIANSVRTEITVESVAGAARSGAEAAAP